MEISIILGPFTALGGDSLEEFLEIVTESQKQITYETASLPEDLKLPKDVVARQWVTDNLVVEAKKASRQQRNAEADLDNLKKETSDAQIKTLKQSKTNDIYEDEFNRVICTTADSEGLSLPIAERIVRERMFGEISDTDIENYLTNKFEAQDRQKLRRMFLGRLKTVTNPDLAIKFTALLFEFDQIKTDGVWGGKLFEQTLVNGFNGETVNLISMICLINKFDYQGGYEAVSDIDAYLKDPTLEAIPLVVDEIFSITKLLDFYGISSTLTLYVADTDYEEIGQYGTITAENLSNISVYIQNLRNYTQNLSSIISVVPISEVTGTNALYLEVKARVLNNLITFDDRDFTNEWYGKFENASEKISDSQSKKGLFVGDDNSKRKSSLNVARNLWACNAGQGAVFGTLGANTVLISTEKRERDQNYIIDKATRGNFPPVIYVLKAAEAWNRKLGYNNASIDK